MFVLCAVGRYRAIRVFVLLDRQFILLLNKAYISQSTLRDIFKTYLDDLNLVRNEGLPSVCVVAWEIRWVLYTHTTNPKATINRTKDTLTASSEREGGRSFVLYRHELLRLLAAPKSPHDALIVESPCLMGFRTKEVATWRAEYIDFQHGDTQVLDAKKHRLFTVPLNGLVAKHAEQILAGRTEGCVIPNLSRAHKGRTEPLSTEAVWYVWRKWARKLDLYPSPEAYSPIVGRRFFAAEWYYTCKLNVVPLSRIMRHGNPEETLRYVANILFYEDLKRDYAEFEFKSMEELARNMVEVKQ